MSDADDYMSMKDLTKCASCASIMGILVGCLTGKEWDVACGTGYQTMIRTTGARRVKRIAVKKSSQTIHLNSKSIARECAHSPVSGPRL